MSGTSESDEGVYSEQVLKVGWPFTTVRGFVRVADGEVNPDGALWLQEDPTQGPVRFLPIQPVWPGLLINSFGITLLWLAIVALWQRGRG